MGGVYHAPRGAIMSAVERRLKVTVAHRRCAAVAGMVAALLAAVAWGQESEPGGYAYSSGDRRDPFADPRRIGSAGPQTRCRCGGPPAFLVQEIALRGVVQTPKGYTAMVEGPDRKSYFARVGDKLYDGTITAVDTAGLTVRQEVTDPLSPVKTREVRVVLHATDGR